MFNDLPEKCLSLRELLPGVAAQRNEEKQPIVSAVLGLAVVKAGQPAEALQAAALGFVPLRAARVWAAKEPRSFGMTRGLLEPALEVAAAGLDHGTRF